MRQIERRQTCCAHLNLLMSQLTPSTVWICCPNIEHFNCWTAPVLLASGSLAIIATAYIPPSANPTAACDVNHGAVAELQKSHLSALITLSGDFSHVSMHKTLWTFTQYVDCPTREEKKLDMLYASINMPMREKTTTT